VIAKGTAEMTKGGAVINMLGPGDFFGEIALVTGQPRTATVTAAEASTLLVLTDRAFWQLAETMPSLQTSILKALAERLHPQAV
jgi:CRP-like cAMP-binding protein